MTLEGPFLSKDWIGAIDSYDKADWILLGLPYDGTCSYRTGTRFAPQEIRLASWGLEEYSPDENKELSDIKFYDAGDLELPFGNSEKVLNIIEKNIKNALDDNKKVFSIGGEHLVTLPCVKAYYEKYPNMFLIHFDAHTDLREEYLGEKLSHASVIRRITDFLPPSNLAQIGIRSGEKEEFEFMKRNNTLCFDINKFKEFLSKTGNCPIYITLDLDVLDPSVMSGTGTLEGGGFEYKELINYLNLIKGKNVVGMDVVELSPHYDYSGKSTAIATKLIREMLLKFA